ncbi:MAG: T9SS type A sorting domain-containing protein, partial [Bacteroidetes bacterium]|nr:T9SS type A sorting domain-containing protein [Bacteroidota bacterium]
SDTNLLDVNVDSNWHYSVRVKDNNGCIGSNSDSIQFTHVPRVPAPTVQCSDRTPFSLEYDWTGLQSHNGAQVSINGGATWITPSSGKTGNSHSMTGLIPEKDYELWVRGVTKSPCFYTEVAKQVCRTGACSPLKAVVVADSQICDGEELRVEVNGLANERFSLSFEGGSAFTDTVFTFSPLVEKSYLIEVTDSNALGCPAKELTFPVHIDKIGLLNFQTQKPSNYFCQDDTIEFRASPGNDVYSFYVNNTLRTSSSDSFYYEDQFKDGDSAFVAVEKGVCMDTSEVIYLNLVPTPNAKFSYDSSGSLYTFTPEITAHSSYLWDFGDGFTSVLTSPDHSYKTSSNQTVVVKLEVEDNSGCLAEAEQTLNLPDFSSIHSLGQGLMKVYPSPVQDVLTIELSNIHTGMNILISDLNGSTVLTAKSDQLITQLDLSSVASGIYLLTIEAEGHAVTQRLMVR